VIGAAVKVMKVATGEFEEDCGAASEGKDKAAADLGQRGGKAPTEKMTPERRADIAKKGSGSALEIEIIPLALKKGNATNILPITIHSGLQR
jgi:hypothetical protein